LFTHRIRALGKIGKTQFHPLAPILWLRRRPGMGQQERPLIMLAHGTGGTWAKGPGA
jgi:hypothetical protein